MNKQHQSSQSCGRRWEINVHSRYDKDQPLVWNPDFSRPCGSLSTTTLFSEQRQTGEKAWKRKFRYPALPTLPINGSTTAVLKFGEEQGSHGSWKTWKVLELYYGIFQDWKVLEKCHWSWKVLEIC